MNVGRDYYVYVYVNDCPTGNLCEDCKSGLTHITPICLQNTKSNVVVPMNIQNLAHMPKNRLSEVTEDEIIALEIMSK